MIRRQRHHWQHIDVFSTVHIAHVRGVKLSVANCRINSDGALHIGRYGERVARQICCARRNLLVVQRYKNVLRIASIDPLTLTVKHVDVEELAPRVDRIALTHRTRASNDAVTGAHGDIKPGLIAVNGSLRVLMSKAAERANDHLQQVALTSNQRRGSIAK